MAEMWLDLSNIPEQGQEYTFWEQALWQTPIQEFQLEVEILDPLQALVFLLPQKRGCFVQGRLTGRVSMPCSRCAEPAELGLDSRFHLLETLEPKDELDRLGPEFIRSSAGVLELDLGGLLWEQFMLQLPFKHVCGQDCQGICPVCGLNLNQGRCQCQVVQGDPRLEIFRNLKINKA
ncbi:MAG: YceD family protein [Desulfohalobiaceae bacterium]